MTTRVVRSHDRTLAKTHHYAHNVVHTSKYTWYDFLPRNIFEQFHRIANVYFLALVVLNWIPQLNVFGKEISMFPLIFVLTVTAVKDAYEDIRRRRSDIELNSRTCRVVTPSGALAVRHWADVHVGDVVFLERDEFVPSDLVLVASAADNGIAYISSMNLDGETNLKVRQSALPHAHHATYETFATSAPIYPACTDCEIQCELPNKNIDNFSGQVTYQAATYPIDNKNVLLRGCVLKNTSWIVGITVYAGHETKSMLNSTRPPAKRSALEKSMNLDVAFLILLLLFLCSMGAIGNSQWLGEDNHPYAIFFPFNIHRTPAFSGFLAFWSFIIVFQVMVPIALYISLELVKSGQAYFIAKDLSIYDEESDTPALCRAVRRHIS